MLLVAGWAKSGPLESLLFGLWRRLLEVDRELFARCLLFTVMGPGFFANNADEAVERAVREFALTLAPGTDRQAELGARVNLHPLVGWISAPTLVVGLKHDQMVPPEQARKLADAIEGARYAEIAAGHLAPWEAPDALAGIIESFLAPPNGREAITDGGGTTYDG